MKRPVLVISDSRCGRNRLHLVLLAAMVGLPLLLAALGGCASSSKYEYNVDGFTPEIPRDPGGRPLPVIVDLTDLRLRPPVGFILTNPGGTERIRKAGGGRLPLNQKQITDERMGRLLAYLRDQGFFDYAQPAGQPPAALPSGTRRTVSAWIGDRPMLRMLDIRGMGTAGRSSEVQAITRISQCIQHVSNSTLSLKVDPRGPRSADDFLKQPGLKRRPAKAR